MAVPQTLSDWYTAKTADTPAPTGLLATAIPPATATTPATEALPGVAPSTSVAPTAYNATTLNDPTTWNVTKDQTTAGQLANITGKDSPLMQQAQTQGLQQANQRGLLNSSMAVGAAQDSVLSHAIPIAQSDADVNARAAGYNADTSNTFSKTNVSIENDAKTFGAQAINRSSEFNAGNEFTKQQAVFDANVKASLDQINNDAGFDRQSQQIFGSLSDTFNKQITLINQDTNMNQQSKDYSINQLYDAYKAQVSMLSAVGSIPDVSALLQTADTRTPDQVRTESLTTQKAAATNSASVEAARVAAAKAVITGATPTDNDVKFGYAEYNSVGVPVFKADFKAAELQKDAAARKSANKLPTQADITNGFATLVGTKITWK